MHPCISRVYDLHLRFKVHCYTHGCAIRSTLRGVKLHPYALQCTHCIKRGVKHKVHQVQRKQTDSHKVSSKCPNTTTSVLACIGQLHHQSATAPILATHATDAVAAHQCDESTGSALVGEDEDTGS